MISFNDEPSGPEKALLLPPIPERPDSANYWNVVKAGLSFCILRPVRGYWKPFQLVNLAAWIVTLCDPEEKEFRRVREEIKKL